jgi:hypothetical protein
MAADGTGSAVFFRGRRAALMIPNRHLVELLARAAERDADRGLVTQSQEAMKAACPRCPW